MTNNRSSLGFADLRAGDVLSYADAEIWLVLEVEKTVSMYDPSEYVLNVKYLDVLNGVVFYFSAELRHLYETLEAARCGLLARSETPR